MSALSHLLNQSSDPSRYFAGDVFNEYEMRTRLSESTYQALHETIEKNIPLKQHLADEIAIAMKHWAVEKGATHYTHWFMPMSGVMAEKHDSFMDLLPDGRVILHFSGKALMQGEPDASSFPSGGLRETSKARGYTSWDCSSPVFIKDKTLYIPTAYFSYTGELLDKKAPLLRSLEALNKEALRMLTLLGKSDARKVNVMVGAEQEYFLVNKTHFEKRPDLKFCGRTLFGKNQVKGQELDDQYLAPLRPQVKAFMEDLDEHLWRLGIAAKSEHNEVAPSQHELAIIFNTASIACDHNQIVMEYLKTLARKHGMECLLHEKPYKQVNGSGKHINWSLSTLQGENLLSLPKTLKKGLSSLTRNDLLQPEVLRFLFILAAVMKAVDSYPELLGLSIMSLSNQHRLGEGEAPPAILSMAIGEELSALLKEFIYLIETGEKNTRSTVQDKQKAYIDLGVSTTSLCTVDATDRNRTSPFAYTGNKFEFRMPGSSCNIATPCFVLNSLVAHSLKTLSDSLEKALKERSNQEPLEEICAQILKDCFQRHGRIIFNGDNYAEAWKIEAQKRGLHQLKKPLCAFEDFLSESSRKVFIEQGILNEKELRARVHILREIYMKRLLLEAKVMDFMVQKHIESDVHRYLGDYAAQIFSCEQVGLNQTEDKRNLKACHQTLQKIRKDLKALNIAVQALNQAIHSEQAKKEEETCASLEQYLYELSELLTDLEKTLPEAYVSFPAYAKLFFDFERNDFV